jgi:hypothetical protein
MSTITSWQDLGMSRLLVIGHTLTGDAPEGYPFDTALVASGSGLALLPRFAVLTVLDLPTDIGAELSAAAQ